MNDIIIGAVASLVASLIWFFGGQIIQTIKKPILISLLPQRKRRKGEEKRATALLKSRL